MKRLLTGLTAGLSILGFACAAHAQTKPNDLPPNVANQPPPRTMSGPPATEAQAKELVLRDGYSDVGTLIKGADGMWRGMARRGEQEMRVTVDTSGKVSP
jgi:hypothetical protein